MNNWRDKNKVGPLIREMMQEDTTQLAASMIFRDFELDAGDQVFTEAELLHFLADHVAWLVEHRMEWLLSLMYRMDIDEKQVEAALLPNAPEPANLGLAKLILARQQERARTKQMYRPKDLGKEWEW